MVCKFQCWLCNDPNYGECVRHLALRSGEHIGVSSSTNKRAQPKKDSAVSHHLLKCNYSPTFQDFSALCHENKKYLLELKESLLIMGDRPSMNWNVRFTLLYLFEWVLVTLFGTLCELLWLIFYFFYLLYVNFQI